MGFKLIEGAIVSHILYYVPPIIIFTQNMGLWYYR